MKQGSKLREFGYCLQIKTLLDEMWIEPCVCRSLREAVEIAAQHVQEMDNYLKVYRHFTADEGVFISSYRSNSTDARPSRKLVVQITDIELLSENDIQEALAYIERISLGGKAR